jgi:hypothetical protein
MHRTILAAACLASACSSSVQNDPIPIPPEQLTVATLSGPLCRDKVCRCRTDEASAGTPDAGFKRFEFRLGPTGDELWATVGDMVLYKSRERATDCFYIDLLPGTHRVSLRARGESGFGAALAVSELGVKGPWWYDTFAFTCGAPGLCDQETLRAWKASIAELGSKHDPCGSTKIAGVTWQTGTMPDDLHPGEMLLQFTLQVYEFVPEHGPGDESCAR